MTLKEFFACKGIKQTGCSRETGIDISMLNKHLNDVQKLPEVQQRTLANYLGITVDEINNNRVHKIQIIKEVFNET
jgi:hypothetical protein